MIHKHMKQRCHEDRMQASPKQTIDLQTCSWTSSKSEDKSLINMGTAPHSITILVCNDVPEAMFVKAQAASNYLKKLKNGVNSLFCTNELIPTY